MNIKEAVKVVNFLHTAYISDNKATASDLAQRAQTYSVTFSEYDLETVMKAAQHCVRTSRFYPTPSELLQACSHVRLTSVSEQAEAQPARVTPIDEKVLDEYLDAFCEWIGFGCEANDDKELPKGVLPYET